MDDNKVYDQREDHHAARIAESERNWRDTNNPAPARVDRRSEVQRVRESAHMRLSQALVAAYHNAKGLTEALSALDHHTNGFSDEERTAIAVAHRDAYNAFKALNSIVIDKGQT